MLTNKKTLLFNAGFLTAAVVGLGIIYWKYKDTDPEDNWFAELVRKITPEEKEQKKKSSSTASTASTAASAYA